MEEQLTKENVLSYIQLHEKIDEKIDNILYLIYHNDLYKTKPDGKTIYRCPICQNIISVSEVMDTIDVWADGGGGEIIPFTFPLSLLWSDESVIQKYINHAISLRDEAWNAKQSFFLQGIKNL